ncbi:MAG: MerR family transcriptional regulator [Actinomycetia bacterium]|nr:MerR family transcriptional regulator [Actinomycetes bacterium]
MTAYTVGELASMAGITVRTLHYYDEIGLLPPTGRTQGGYRQYDDSAVDKLRTILTFRELGLGLEEVARAIADHTNAHATLRDAHNRITSQITRLTAIAASLEHAIQEESNRGTMTPEEKLSVFGDFDPDEHTEEATKRWGDTEEFAQSEKRTDEYTNADWETINGELDDIHRRLLVLRDAGTPASSAEAAALVDEHRAHLSRWYYKCTPVIHKGLGQMYTQDPRFTENINKAGDGLAAYLSDAIAARYT